MKIEHIAMYVKDLERAKTFFETYFQGMAGEKYTNEKKGFSSYFISFSDATRLELMQQVGTSESVLKKQFGFAHIAFSLGDKANVLSLTEQLRIDGYSIVSEPRTTGDGYFESCIADMEGNLIELTI